MEDLKISADCISTAVAISLDTKSAFLLVTKYKLSLVRLELDAPSSYQFNKFMFCYTYVCTDPKIVKKGATLHIDNRRSSYSI